MLNVAVIQGRMAANPELRQTTTGKQVATFRLACDRGRKDQSGQSLVDWINVVAWGQTAEFAYKYFAKGSLAVAEGRLQTRMYKDKNGQNRQATEVLADRLYFGESKRSQSANDQNSPAGLSNDNEASDDFAIVEDNGDLPF